jgi:hypothetical protein
MTGLNIYTGVVTLIIPFEFQEGMCLCYAYSSPLLCGPPDLVTLRGDATL